MTDIHKLLIEGQQFVGKTTIANNLARRYLSGNPFLFKLSGPAAGKFDGNFQSYMDNLLLDYANLFRHITANSIISDKFHISEQVYGRFYRGYEHDQEVIEAVEAILHEQGFRVVYLTMDDELIDERIKLKQIECHCKADALPSPQDQKKIKKQYEQSIKKTRLDAICVDVTNKSVLETVQDILSQL